MVMFLVLKKNLAYTSNKVLCLQLKLIQWPVHSIKNNLHLVLILKLLKILVQQLRPHLPFFLISVLFAYSKDTTQQEVMKMASEIDSTSSATLNIPVIIHVMPLSVYSNLKLNNYRECFTLQVLMLSTCKIRKHLYI